MEGKTSPQAAAAQEPIVSDQPVEGETQTQNTPEPKAVKAAPTVDLGKYPMTRQAVQMYRDELQLFPWPMLRNLALAIGRQIDLADLEHMFPVDTKAPANPVCPLCGRPYIARRFSLIKRDGSVVTGKDGQPIVLGNYFPRWYDGKFQVIGVCGHAPMPDGRDGWFPQCYEACRDQDQERDHNGEPKRRFGLPYEDALALFARLRENAADRERGRQDQIGRISKLGDRGDSRNSGGTAGDRIFGRGRSEGGQGGAYGNRGDKRRFQR